MAASSESKQNNNKKKHQIASVCLLICIHCRPPHAPARFSIGDRGLISISTLELPKPASALVLSTIYTALIRRSNFPRSESELGGRTRFVRFVFSSFYVFPPSLLPAHNNAEKKSRRESRIVRWRGGGSCIGCIARTESSGASIVPAWPLNLSVRRPYILLFSKRVSLYYRVGFSCFTCMFSLELRTLSSSRVYLTLCGIPSGYFPVRGSVKVPLSDVASICHRTTEIAE